MSSIESSSSGFYAVFHSLERKLSKYLPESSKRSWVILQSTALLQVSFASLKNIPYAFVARDLGIYDPVHFLSSRVTYLEATLLAVVSTIHHLIFGCVYTGLTIGTLGIFDSLNFSCWMHWHHFTYGIGGIVIGIVGMLAPYYGVLINGGLLYLTWDVMKDCYGYDVRSNERELVMGIQEIFRKWRVTIFDLVRQKAKDEDTYEKVHRPSIEYIENRIHSAQRIGDLLHLAIAIRDQWPEMDLTDFDPTKIKSLGNPAIHKHYE